MPSSNEVVISEYSDMTLKDRKTIDYDKMFAFMNSRCLHGYLTNNLDPSTITEIDIISVISKYELLSKNAQWVLAMLFRELSELGYKDLCNSVMQFITDNPPIAREIYETGEVQLGPRGIIDNGLQYYASQTFRHAQYRGKTNPGLQLQGIDIVIETLTTCKMLTNATFIKALNRTLLFRMPDNGGQNTFRAFKLKKINEDTRELMREYQMLSYLHANKRRLDLQSALPEPHGLFRLKDIMQFVPDNIKDIVDAENGQGICYVYDAPSEYFDYIHNENMLADDFVANFKKTLHDIAVLFKADGIIYHQLIDLFHTTSDTHERRDKGRYVSILTLLETDPEAQGKLAMWMKSTRYPNIRGSGLADFGDMLTVNDVFISPEVATQSINGLQKSAGHHIYQFIGDYFLIIELIVGYRTRKIQDQNPTIDHTQLWQKATEQLVELSTFLSKMLDIIDCYGNPLQYAKLTNLDCYSKQMQFFMTKDYVSAFTHKKIPKDLYPENTKVKVAYSIVSRPDEWDPQIGFISPGSKNEQDLGPYNGPYPIQAGVIAREQLITYFATKSGLPDYVAGWRKTGAILFSYAQRDLNQSQREFDEDMILKRLVLRMF